MAIGGGELLVIAFLGMVFVVVPTVIVVVIVLAMRKKP